MTAPMQNPDPEEDRPDGPLVQRARAGDRGAMGELINRHQGVVYRFLVGLLGDEELAADTTQETFVRALGNIAGFRGDSTFRTWLLAIARNEARGAMRRRVRRREFTLDDAPPLQDQAAGPEHVTLGRAEVGRIRTALDSLPPKQKMSVSLRLFDGLSFREIGRAIDSSEGAARVNYHHGIRRLRELLDDRGN
ncbi:MAG: RNA polymerase sigma factor [Gemmatimonadales bacterium]|nr:MAG: RNA polymerase sigma factor [Gemmatimonadales bacterium]